MSDTLSPNKYIPKIQFSYNNIINFLLLSTVRVHEKGRILLLLRAAETGAVGNRLQFGVTGPIVRKRENQGHDRLEVEGDRQGSAEGTGRQIQ